MKEARQYGFATRAIHHGYDPYEGQGSLTPPIYVSSTYAFPTAEIGGQRFAGEAPGYVYSRIGNPTTSLLGKRLAELEGAEAAVVTASGMGAISSLLWTLLRPGDELLTDQTLYGCTFAFFHKALVEFGITVRHIDLLDLASVEGEIGERTKLIYFETPANPNMRVVDIAEVSAIAHRHGVEVAVDNIYLTPYLQQPIQLGADYVVHSATKYLGGHGDLLAGAVVGSQAAMDQVRFLGVKDMTGSCLSAFDAHLLLRGLKTLNLRMDRHCATAQVLAEMLASHPAVENVYYPGLPSDPGYALAKRQMKGAGGMIAVDLKGGVTAGLAFINALEIFIRAVSLGDCESLAQHPASMTHSNYTPEERREHGIHDGTVRLSVGLEDPDDLVSDVKQALDAAMRTIRLAG